MTTVDAIYKDCFDYLLTFMPKEHAILAQVCKCWNQKVVALHLKKANEEINTIIQVVNPILSLSGLPRITQIDLKATYLAELEQSFKMELNNIAKKIGQDVQCTQSIKMMYTQQTKKKEVGYVPMLQTILSQEVQLLSLAIVAVLAGMYRRHQILDKDYQVVFCSSLSLKDPLEEKKTKITQHIDHYWASLFYQKKESDLELAYFIAQQRDATAMEGDLIALISKALEKKDRKHALLALRAAKKLVGHDLKVEVACHLISLGFMNEALQLLKQCEQNHIIKYQTALALLLVKNSDKTEIHNFYFAFPCLVQESENVRYELAMQPSANARVMINLLVRRSRIICGNRRVRSLWRSPLFKTISFVSLGILPLSTWLYGVISRKY